MLSTQESVTGPSHRPKASLSHGLGDLRTPRLLSRWPVITLVVFLLAVSLFGVLAINLKAQSPLIQTDTQIVNDLHEFALQNSPFVRTMLSFGFPLGEGVVLVIGVVLAFYFAFKRFWTELSMVLIGWFGEGGIWYGLSQYFNRPRPHFAVLITNPVPGPGFPSGHTMGAVVCYGLLAYLLVMKMPSRFWKAVLILLTFLLILYIGFSRVYVGDHYPTDVLAGYALGIAWSVLAYTAVEIVSSVKKKPKQLETR